MFHIQNFIELRFFSSKSTSKIDGNFRFKKKLSFLQMTTLGVQLKQANRRKLPQTAANRHKPPQTFSQAAANF